MRHRRKGRVLGRSPSHQRALLKNLAAALFLTEKAYEADAEGAPKVPGRIITTLPKAKEVRPVVERCITLAIRSMPAVTAAKEFAPPSKDGVIDRRSEAYKTWKKSDKRIKYAQAIAPNVNARRRVNTMLGGNKEAVSLCFDVVAPRFTTRPGGYTRILKLATPRLGDAGKRAMLEFVGKNDRETKKAVAPAIEG